MPGAGLVCLAFALTAGETSVGTRYTRAVAEKRRGAAVGYGVLFEALLLADIWFLVSDRWLAIPILIGAAVGTWWAVR